MALNIKTLLNRADDYCQSKKYLLYGKENRLVFTNRLILFFLKSEIIF